MNISEIRKDYMLKELSEADADFDPVKQFRTWWTEAVNSSIEEVNAMTLATADENGIPSARIVLLKGFDDSGFVFFTNYNSRKARELEQNPNAAIVFFWKELERQIRITGRVKRISPAENEVYFQSRPHGSKIGAWASPQSSVIQNREDIERKVQEVEMKFADSTVNCPPFWGGYVLKPSQIEFWQGRPNRLHDRIRYRFQDNSWMMERLAP